MPLPVPVPTAYQGQGNLYNLVYKFAQGRLTWAEKWYVIVKGTNAPTSFLSYLGAALARARLTFLDPSASITEVRSAYVNVDPLNPVKQSYAGDNPLNGSGKGTRPNQVTVNPQNKGPAVPELTWQWAFYDATLSLKEVRGFRGLSEIDNTWTPTGGYGPSAQVQSGLEQMGELIGSQYTHPLFPLATAQIVLASRAIVGASPPFVTISYKENPPGTVVSGLTADSFGRLQVKFQQAANIQKGWVGVTPAVPLTDIVAGDQIILAGNRIACARGINGPATIVSVSSSGAGDTTIWTLTTSKFPCCSSALYNQWTGNVRASQEAYYPIAKAEPIQIATRSTGVGGGGPRGRARASCCS